MADGTQINPMSGGDTISTADTTSINGAPVSGVKVERVKVGYGEGPAHVDVDTDTPLPVSLIGDDDDADMVMLLSQILSRLGANNGLGRMLVDIAAGTAVAQSGTWTVQPGNTANTTAWLMALAASSTSLYGPQGFALDQHYQSIQAYDAIRSKIVPA